MTKYNTIITDRLTQYIATKTIAGEKVELSEFVFANLSQSQLEALNRFSDLPPEYQIVHRQAVSQAGVVNQDSVAYSVTMGTDTGDFSFNWIGLLTADGDLAVMMKTALTDKVKNKHGIQGNSLTRSLLLEFAGAAEQTQIDVSANTWQIDFTARLAGIDDAIRQTNLDLYGESRFFDNGFLCTKQSQRVVNIKAGVGYVHGHRITLDEDATLEISKANSAIYIDVVHQGTVTSKWETSFTFLTDEVENYTDRAGYQHYIVKLCDIGSSWEIIDQRQTGKNITELELSAPDGGKYIGECDSIEQLRTIEPHMNNQKIYVKGYHKNSILGGGIFIGKIDKSKNEDNVNIFYGLNGMWIRVSQKNVTIFNAGKKQESSDEDSISIARLESIENRLQVDLCGETLVLDEIPTKHDYFNGKINIAGEIYSIDQQRNIFLLSKQNQKSGSKLSCVALGEETASRLKDLKSDWHRSSFVAIGRGALNNTQWGRSCIAIGAGAMGETQRAGFANIAIGDWALRHITAQTANAAEVNGTRNIAIGTLALTFLQNGARNVFVGRDAGQCLVDGAQNVSVGYASLSSGKAPVNVKGYIENQAPAEFSLNTALGCFAAGGISSGERSVFIGAYAARNLKKSIQDVIIGVDAAKNLEKDTLFNGSEFKDVEITKNYSITDNQILIDNVVDGDLAAEKYIEVKFNTGINLTDEVQRLKINNYSSNRIYIDLGSEQSLANTSGSCTILKIEKQRTSRLTSSQNTIIGAEAVGGSVGGVATSTVVGWQAGENLAGKDNTFVGTRAGRFLTNANRCVGVGTNALNVNIWGDKSNWETLSNSAALGVGATVSGNDQVQIGAYGQTVYTHTAPQTRSDERDKTDIKPLDLGLNFIKEIRPVQYRWNYRDAYIEIDDETGEVIRHNNDGSKAGKRYHTGVIAQELKQAMDRLDIDFGGYQDHKINGGGDVLTVAYQEFIPVLIKAVQELANEHEKLLAKVNKLEE